MVLAFVSCTCFKMQTWTPDQLGKGFWDDDPKVKNFGQNSLLSHYFWLWATNKEGTEGLVSAFAQDGGTSQVETLTIRSQTSTEDDITYMEHSVKSMCRDGVSFVVFHSIAL